MPKDSSGEKSRYITIDDQCSAVLDAGTVDLSDPADRHRVEERGAEAFIRHRIAAATNTAIGKGPAQVSSDRYRQNWDNIFGRKEETDKRQLN